MESYHDAMLRARREYLAELLAYCDGDVPKAARIGKVHRSLIYKVIGAPKPPRKVIHMFGRKLGRREVDLSAAPLAQKYGAR